MDSELTESSESKLLSFSTHAYIHACMTNKTKTTNNNAGMANWIAEKQKKNYLKRGPVLFFSSVENT